jgi:hypothetical protein
MPERRPVHPAVRTKLAQLGLRPLRNAGGHQVGQRLNVSCYLYRHRVVSDERIDVGAAPVVAFAV